MHFASKTLFMFKSFRGKFPAYKSSYVHFEFESLKKQRNLQKANVFMKCTFSVTIAKRMIKICLHKSKHTRRGRQC